MRWGFWDSRRIGWKKLQHSCLGQLAVPRGGGVVVCLSLEHKGQDASSCPQAGIFSCAPWGQLFSQEPGQALSVVSETKALTYTLLARLTTFYLKLKFPTLESPIKIWSWFFKHEVFLDCDKFIIGNK